MPWRIISKPADKVELYYGLSVQKGDKLLYHSATHDRWLPCTITAVDAKRRALQIDLKPNYWMRGAELLKLKCDEQQLKRNREAAAAASSPMKRMGACMQGICRA